MKLSKTSKRNLPAVDYLLRTLTFGGLPRAVVVAEIRRHLSACRKASSLPTRDQVLSDLQSQLDALDQQRLQGVINATGIVLHTNLGRAPFGAQNLEKLKSTVEGYCNLEFDLQSGKRGARGLYAEKLLATLCDAQAATVVNNCAASLVLILRTLCQTKPDVLVSRSELIQIGGGFRIPEMIEASGVTLVEVGSTNKTTVEDYETAINQRTAVILKVHKSNFTMSGFVEEPSLKELASMASRRKIPLIYDQGSGAFFNTETLTGEEREQTPAMALKKGASLVCFSGDKLLGGPQAGIIAGKSTLVSKLKKAPLFRAFRCDKLVMKLLELTVESHLKTTDPGTESSPAIQHLFASTESLRRRGKAIIAAISDDSQLRLGLEEQPVETGGGTLPTAQIPSIAIKAQHRSEKAKTMLAKLRRQTPPVVGYVKANALYLNLRSISPEQDSLVQNALAELAGL